MIDLLLSLMSGGLLGLSCLDERYSMGIWVAIAPLVYSLRGDDRRRHFLCGWLAGLVWFLISCRWLRHVTWLGLIFLALFEATYLGLWMMLVSRFTRPWRYLIFPTLWICMEMVRSKGALGFSWNLVGHRAEPLLPYAQVWGVYGISFMVVAANVAIAALALYALEKLRPAPPLSTSDSNRDAAEAHNSSDSDPEETYQRWMPEGAGFFLLAPLLWLGVAFYEYVPVPKPDSQITVGMAQGSFPQSLKWTVPLQEAVERYVALTDSLMQSHRLDLMVWPEVALPTILSEEPGLALYLIEQAERWAAPLLFGALDMDLRHEGAAPLYNSAILLDPNHLPDDLSLINPSRLSQFLRGAYENETRDLFFPSAYARMNSIPSRIYDKSRLLPFGEFVPFGKILTFIQKFVEDSGGGAFSSGSEGKVLETRYGSIGPLICFESTHAALARKAVLNGALLLVNMTNDAWFLRTQAGEQHALQCRLRAIESGRAIVRSANTGISAVYLPDGSVTSKLPEWTQASGAAEVPLFNHFTFYARVGDFFCWLCLASLAFSILLSIDMGSPLNTQKNDE